MKHEIYPMRASEDGELLPPVVVEVPDVLYLQVVDTDDCEDWPAPSEPSERTFTTERLNASDVAYVPAARAEAELETVREAAHMPDDWPHGLPSWIAQRLYAAYIGAAFAPEVMEQIAAGRLAFPEAPIYAEAAALRAERDAARAAQEWRPVTEPPTDNGDYLVWVKYPKEPGFHSVARWTQRFKWENNFVHPTYWQPLPAAPGDGGEEVK